jgi:hypothetical protein
MDIVIVVISPLFSQFLLASDLFRTASLEESNFPPALYHRTGVVSTRSFP